MISFEDCIKLRDIGYPQDRSRDVYIEDDHNGVVDRGYLFTGEWVACPHVEEVFDWFRTEHKFLVVINCLAKYRKSPVWLYQIKSLVTGLVIEECSDFESWDDACDGALQKLFRLL